MIEFYKINLDGKYYSLKESDCFELHRALHILKSIVFFDNNFEYVVPGLLVGGYNKWEYSNFDYDYTGIDEEDDLFEISCSYRISLEELYKKIGGYVSDDLKPLFCEDGVPNLLFYDTQMDLVHNPICTAVVDGEEKRRFICGNKDDKKEFYSKYYEPLEKLVDLIDNIDPFGLR